MAGGIRMAEHSGAPGAEGKTPRRARGFRPAGALIAQQTRTAAARRGYADARLKALWPEIAGSEIAAVATPVKLTPARGPAGGLLTLGVQGANGPQVQMLLPLIRDRLNAALGPNTVGRVRLTQAPGFAEAPATFERPDPPPPAPPDLSDYVAPLSSIGDGELRAALETLARNVVSRSRTTAARPATRGK
jgi:hypothetical protein